MKNAIVPVFAGVIVFMVLTVAMVNSNHAAMAVCQIDHSYDVCFEALNR